MADQQDVLEQATGWLTSEPGVSSTEKGSVEVAGDPPLPVGLTADEEQLTMTCQFFESGGGAARADQVIGSVPTRGTQLHAAASVDSTGVTITLSNKVYLDGLSRQAVVTALNDLISAADTARRETPNGAQQAAATPNDAQAPTPDGGATRIEEAVATPKEDPTPIPAPEKGAWSPTHRVPSGGMRAWDDPDPDAPPAARLEPGVELAVLEKRGEWARVVGENDWTGWVDARRLEETSGVVKPAKASSTIDIGGLALRPLPLAGAAAALLAVFLPWVDAGIATLNSLDVSLSFLWDLGAQGSPYLGWALIAAVAAGAIGSATKKPLNGLVRLAGVVAIAIAIVFVVQIYRGVTDGGGTVGDAFDLLGFAPWIAVGGGVIMLAGARN